MKTRHTTRVRISVWHENATLAGRLAGIVERMRRDFSAVEYRQDPDAHRFLDENGRLVIEIRVAKTPKGT